MILVELEALCELYDKKIFSYNLNEESGDLNGEFVAFNKLIDDQMMTILGNETEHKVSYLPPIHLKFKTNINSENQNLDLSLNSPWLPNRFLQMIDNKIKEIISESDEGGLWLCFEFLENDGHRIILEDDKDSASVINLNDIFPFDTEFKIDETLQLLIQYNDERDESLFKNLIIECEVCMIMKRGDECTKFDVCSHMVCTPCLLDHFNTRISIGCLNLSCAVCGEELDYEQVRKVMDSQSFERWDTLSFDNCVKTLDDHRPCTRCQTFIAVNPDDGYGFCKNCRYTFCLDCKETFNGPKCCNNLTAENLELEAQRIANKAARIKPRLPSFDQMEKAKRKERRQYFSKEAVMKREEQELQVLKRCNKEFKCCPECRALYEKNGGCNHMRCPYCSSHFCYLCNKKISSTNPYSHFTANKCVLFKVPKGV